MYVLECQNAVMEKRGKDPFPDCYNIKGAHFYMPVYATIIIPTLKMLYIEHLRAERYRLSIELVSPELLISFSKQQLKSLELHNGQS